MRIQESRDHRSRRNGGSYTYVAEYTPKMSVGEFMGYLKGKSTFMIFKRHANVKLQVWKTGIPGKRILCQHGRRKQEGNTEETRSGTGRSDNGPVALQGVRRPQGVRRSVERLERNVKKKRHSGVGVSHCAPKGAAGMMPF